MARTRSRGFRSWRHSLRFRLVMVLVVVNLVALVLSVLAITAFVYRTEKATWETRQHQAAYDAASTVEGFLDQVRQYITLVGLLDRGYLEANPEVMFDLLYQNPALLEVIRLDKEGEVFASAYQEDTPVLGNLFTIAQSSWFQQALKGQLYAGDIQISAANQPYLILASPAPDGGVTAARLSMRVLWEVVSGTQFGETGQAYVVNRQGYIVAHPDPQVVLARTTIAQRPEMASALAAPRKEWSGTYQNFQGRSVLGSTLPLAGGDWLIFTEVSRAEAFDVTRQALLLLTIGGLVFVVVTIIVMSLLLDRVILGPVDELRDGAERIGRGDLEHRIESRYPDEIGQVAAEFNIMAARLKEREHALAQARDEAQAASRFKSRLLANVSHDLRTPLTAILGFADMLLEGVYGHLADRQYETVERIMANSQRLMSLINSILDQAQIEAGKIKLNYAPFRPAEVLAEVESVMGILAQKKGLNLISEIDPQVPEVLTGDRQRVLQILMNLVDNALKFTDRGSIRIHLSTNKRQWSMEVADTGRGIPASEQLSIFDAFRQVDSSTTRARTGVGLGLSIVHQLASRMGGRVFVASQVGEGSTFKVFLPLDPEEET